MKRLLTLSFVALLAIAGFATPQVAMTKGDALKKLMQQEALTAKLEAMSQQNTPAAAAEAPQQLNELDTVEVVFKSFYDDPLYYEAGDWYIVLRNERYQFIFDFYGGTPEDPSGTYTEKDLDTWFSWCMFPEAEGNTSYYKTCNLTVKKEQRGSNTTYTLEATIVTTLGIDGPVNGAFKVRGTHQCITASKKYEVAILDCSVTPEDDRFSLVGKNDTMDVAMTFFTTEGVVGYYTHKMLDEYETKFMHRNVPYTILELDGMIVTTETIDGGVAYVAMMEILAGSAKDTVFFNVAMEAPVKTTETVNVVCNDLFLDSSLGMSQSTITISASNAQYSIYAGYNDKMVRDSATYNGTNAMAYITEVETEKMISALQTALTVVGSKEKGYTVTADIVGSDHKRYNLYLTNVIPEVLDTINIAFPDIAKSMYYVDILGLHELQLANYTENYSVSFDILYIDRVMGGEFEMSNLFMDQTFIVKHSPYGDEHVGIAFVNGEIYQENDTTFLNAEVMGYDSLFYNISMYYTVPTPSETISYTFTEDFTLFTNALPDPDPTFILSGMTEDGKAMANVQVHLVTSGSVEGTFVNDGEFIVNDFDPFNTFVSVKNPVNNEYENFYVQKGEMTVTIVDGNILKAKANFICDDGKLYDLTFLVKYERPRLPYDAEEDGVEYTYTADAYIAIDDYVESHNMLFFEMLPVDYSNVVSLCFIIDEKDPEIIIPEGTYPITGLTDPATVGTVVASRGLSASGYPLQSYFAELEVYDNELYYVEGRGFFLVDGTVTIENVDGALKMDVNAVNSYDLPVILHYDASQTPVENVEGDKVATGGEKHVENGQLFIKHNGMIYNVTGARVK